MPQIDKAIWSAENAVTLIYEGQLQPFGKKVSKKVGGRMVIATKDLHLHELPWPVDVLRQFPDVTVRMRITLSYFIEPSPGRKGWTRKYSYQSHGLRFKVKRVNEPLPDFRARLSREAKEEEQEGIKEENAPSVRQGVSQPWTLGRNLRSQGSIHSDWWEGSAIDLADCGYIGVFPVTGWWRERHHLGKLNRSARYSLIVSLETERTDIDLYAAIASQVGIATQIET